jgi:hypothetical protein
LTRQGEAENSVIDGLKALFFGHGKFFLIFHPHIFSSLNQWNVFNPQWDDHPSIEAKVEQPTQLLDWSTGSMAQRAHNGGWVGFWVVWHGENRDFSMDHG